MNDLPYFMGENGNIVSKENGEQEKCLISFASSDEERNAMQKEIDANKEKINASKKRYLILFSGYSDGSDEINYKDWALVEGRENAYNAIKEMFLDEYIAENGITFDAYRSRIIVESNSGKIKLTGISVYKFVKAMITEGKIVDDDGRFDIEEWAEDAKDNTD